MDTPSLFDEEHQTPAGMVSVSQLQTYLSCKRKWEYNYIENLKPRVEKTYLTIGKLCHKGMQIAMHKMWEREDWTSAMFAGVKAIEEDWEKYVAITPLLDEEFPDIEQMLVDAKSVFMQAFEEFEPWKYEVVTVTKQGKPAPALELHFVVPCGQTAGLHGFIDAILRDKETGFTWNTDYKFRKSLSPDEDEAFNIQNAVYAYACKQMGVDITGTMTWQHVNTPASDPAILKDGRISRAKIKTTWTHYENFCIKHGVDPQEYYLEMEEKLRDIEWFRATYEYRNEETIQRIWDQCVLPAAESLHVTRGLTQSGEISGYRSLYPWNCKMCQYQSICQAELRDYDVEAIKEREYVRR